MKRLILALMSVPLALMLGACSAGPTATPAAAATHAATDTPTSVPTATPTAPRPLPPLAAPCPPGDGAVYDVGEWIVEDGAFELRMGADAYWGYEAEQRVSSLTDGIVMTFNPGDTLRIGTLRSSSSRSTMPHGITVVGLGVDIQLAVGESREGVVIAVCEVGIYAIDDFRDRGAHGIADIVVKEPPPLFAGPVIYEADSLVLEDGIFELRMGSEGYWGYAPGDRASTRGGEEIVITAKVGDTLSFGLLRQSGSRSTKPHSLTIEGLGIDIPLADANVSPFEIELEREGTFLVDDSSDPGEHGVFKIVVGPGGPPSTVYALDSWVVEDGVFELRMGLEGYWGYAPGDRVSTRGGDEIVMTARVGDTITINLVRQSGSRSTKPHRFTIEGLGIDAPLADANVAVLELKLDAAGTFLIDDSSDPGEHGSARIVVE